MSLPTVIKTSVNVATAAGTASVSSADAKNHLKVEHTADDTLIGNLIKAADADVEAFTNRKLISQTIDMYLTEFPANGITLPYNPVTSITSVKYYDTANSLQTWASTNYHYNIYEEPCVIRYVNTPPATYQYRSDAIVVRFVCGYTNQAAVPENLIAAVLLRLGDLYENRVDTIRENENTFWKNVCRSEIVWHYEGENT